MKLTVLTAIGPLVVAARLPVYLYVDEWDNPTTPIQTKMMAYAGAGASHLVLAFHVMTDDWKSSGYAADTVASWMALSTTDRQKLVSDLHQVGTEVILSTGGASADITWLAIPPAEYAASACGMAAQLGVDGIDFDLEGLPALFGSTANSAYGVWNKQVIAECKKHFNGYITSAPQAPYLLDDWSGAYGFDTYGYDKLLIQYYNQGTWLQDHTKEGLFGSQKTSIKSLMAKHPEAPKDTFVVGKPLIDGEDGSGGNLSMQDLHDWGCEAKQEYGWTGGFMFWRGHWDRAEAQAMISTIAKPCPFEQDVPATPVPTTPTPTRPTVPTTPTPTRPTVPTTPTPTRPTVPTTPIPTRPTLPSTSALVTPRPTVPTTPTPTTSRPTTPSAPRPTEPIDINEVPTMCPALPKNSLIEECMGRITSEPQWAASCKGYCLTMAPGGCISNLCAQPATTPDSLLACIKAAWPFCRY